MSLLCPCTSGRSSQRDAKYSLNSAGPSGSGATGGANAGRGGRKLTPKQISDQIDEQIKQDKRRRRQERRILLLGTAASGKSTFLRSLRIIHKDQFDEREVRSFQAVIYANVWRGIMKLLFIKKQLGIKWESSKPGIAAVKSMLALESEIGQVNVVSCNITEDQFLRAAPHIRTLWCDSGVRESFERRHSVQGDEEFRDLDSIAMPGYRPTEAHILHSRRFTDSVFEKPLMYNGIPLLIIDIGGHTNERRKWAKTLRVFRGELQSVIYIIACSTFNEFYTKPATGELINKLDESFDCLRHLLEIKTELFTPDMSLIVFFNKDDLFSYKIETLRVNYAQYDTSFDSQRYDPTNLGHVREHLLRRLNVVLNASLQLKKYTHFTTSIDLSNVRRVFKDVQDTVMHNFIRRRCQLEFF
uniref:G-protein alpha subunit n=1 Tax=Macrostomum lignano TaxID=282301 RepID=A0A1I8F110_9PLAT